MLLPLALLLGGCVSQPAPMSPKVTVGGSVGGVSLQARQAQLRLRLYAVVQGRMQTIAERRYRVSGLPLRYAFDLEVDRLGGRGIVPAYRAFLGGRRGGPGECLATGGGGRR